MRRLVVALQLLHERDSIDYEELGLYQQQTDQLEIRLRMGGGAFERMCRERFAHGRDDPIRWKT
ncbi:MAG: hypothetical protein V3V06_08635 [Dehalococcoidia bacterium]